MNFKNFAEDKIFEKMPPVSGAEERIEKAAENIASKDDHELNVIFRDPWWIRKTLGEKWVKKMPGEEEAVTFKANFQAAAEEISNQTGYPVELIKKVYELRWAPEKRH